MLTHCPIHNRPSVGFCQECRADYEQHRASLKQPESQSHAVRDFAYTFAIAICAYLLVVLWMAM